MSGANEGNASVDLLQGDDPIAVVGREMADWTNARLARIVYGLDDGSSDFARMVAAQIILRNRNGPDAIDRLVDGFKMLPLPETT